MYYLPRGYTTSIAWQMEFSQIPVVIIDCFSPVA
jgi:hypothetical protein